MVSDHVVAYERISGPAFPSRLATWSRRLALFSFQLVVLDVALHRLFSLPTPVALNIFAAAWVGAAIAVLLGLASIVSIWRQGLGGGGSAALGIVVALLVIGIPAFVLQQMMSLPKIYDLTTDANSPPRFLALAASRPKDANPIAYPGAESMRLQTQAYPDIRPVIVPRSAGETFEIVGDTLRRLRWEIAAEERPRGPYLPGFIEAVERSLVLGFYDDVSIRIVGNDRESRVDVRSAARYGPHDLGRNAARIRGFFREFQTRIDASVPAGGLRGRRVRPGAAVPKRQKGASGSSPALRKSQGRAPQDSGRGQQSREKQRQRGEDPGRDRRPERYPR
jgi:uncharacterized protein (DUF1499 family)